MRYSFLLVLVLVLCQSVTTLAQVADVPMSAGDALLAEYFARETSAVTEHSFAGIDSLDDWQRLREGYRRQLLDMLGLDPMPERTPLEARVVGSVEAQGVIVERVHFQSMPGLYVTANLYRPMQQDGPLPAILYVCGHANVKENGTSLGNKTAYQHHGGWFARNGYVCLTIDTIQLGEIAGIHHGTYRERMWWWNNRGYTPAGVEAWNCVRALDYLQSRAEVDGERIGVTGRSGGGAYSYWIAAIDERIQVAVPVAGITSLKNHVVDGCVEGHCDCMYMLNTYRWDFPMVAALIAPRPLLIANTDKDRIFPLDGVVDVYTKTKQIYSLYDAEDHLGLYLTEGPHQDTQELQLGAFRWLNRFLKDEQPLVEMAATPLFERSQLKVFDSLPEDERVSSIHESFVPQVQTGEVAIDSPEQAAVLINQLSERTFRGWPSTAEPLNVEVTPVASTATSRESKSRESTSAIQNAEVIEFTSQSPYRLRMYRVTRNASETNGAGLVDVIVWDEQQWRKQVGLLAALFPGEFPEVEPDQSQVQSWLNRSQASQTVFVVPRGVGPTAWTSDERRQTHIRRRFMLLGQTQAAMQIYDVRRALQTLQQLSGTTKQRLRLVGRGDAAVWAMYASLFVDGIDSLSLSDLPTSNRDAPDLINISRVAELGDVLKVATMRTNDSQGSGSQESEPQK